MKTRVLIITTALLMSFSAIFANDIKPVPKSIVNELNREFKEISNLQWKTTDNYYKASFIDNGQPLEAFYSYEAKLIGVSKVIKLNQLPMNLAKEAKEKGAPNQVTQLFELLTERGTEYFITFNTGKEIKTFKSDGYDWVRY